MKREICFTILLSLLTIFSVDAQSIPEVTEVHEPVPPIVTPGDFFAPPCDAIVLFDGSNLDGWMRPNGDSARWEVSDDIFTVAPRTGDIQTRSSFGDVQLHIEWRSPEEVRGNGQGRGNSGVFLMGRYEIQILDSYNNPTYPNGQAASVYKQHIPLVNASRGPGEWQTFDIIFMAPRFHENGRVAVPARVTVFHNGVLVQNNIEIWGDTQFIGLPEYRPHADKLPIRLQDHGNGVSFRNIWVREL